MDREPECEPDELLLLDDLDFDCSFFGESSPKIGRVHDIGGRITDVFMIRDNFVTPFDAVTPYSIRFFHPELAFPLPHLDDFQSFPLTLRYVILLVDMKKLGVLFPSVLSCGNMMVNASFDISTSGTILLETGKAKQNLGIALEKSKTFEMKDTLQEER